MENLNTNQQQKPSTKMVAVKRCLRRKCPKCGVGQLYSFYLNYRKICTSCGERFEDIATDDAAPWLTILLTGHVIMPLMLMVERAFDLPAGFSQVFWPFLGVLVAAMVLPFAKAFFFALIWESQKPTQENEADVIDTNRD